MRGILFWRRVFCDLWHAELEPMRQWSPVPLLDIDVAEGDGHATARTLGRTGGVPGDAAVMELPRRITLDQWDLRYEISAGRACASRRMEDACGGTWTTAIDVC